jgi:hypothetical protein
MDKKINFKSVLYRESIILGFRVESKHSVEENGRLITIPVSFNGNTLNGEPLAWVIDWGDGDVQECSDCTARPICIEHVYAGDEQEFIVTIRHNESVSPIYFGWASPMCLDDERFRFEGSSIVDYTTLGFHNLRHIWQLPYMAQADITKEYDFWEAERYSAELAKKREEEED